MCAAVALIVVGLAPVAGQGTSPDPMAPAAVTGLQLGCTVAREGWGDQDPGDLHESLIGQIVTCTQRADDPRVTGGETAVLWIEAYDPAALPRTGPYWYNDELVPDADPDSAWTGRGFAVLDGEGAAHALVVLRGSGAYQGLTYAYVASPLGSATITGVIYAGDPPPDFPTQPLPVPTPPAQ
jgi:hypothetical protein